MSSKKPKKPSEVESITLKDAVQIKRPKTLNKRKVKK